MSKDCDNCKGKVVLSYGGMAAILILVSFACAATGFIEGKGRAERAADEQLLSVAQECNQDCAQLKLELTTQLEDCERGFKITADEGGMGIWDLYYRKWYVP
jgi:hypothetical protein